MDIINGFDEIKKDTNTVVTIGTFDGLHIGHKRIIEKLKEKAGFYKGRSAVITFNPHPRTVFNTTSPVGLLSTPEEKAELFGGVGVDLMWVINFTKEFASLTSEEFVKGYLVEKLGVKEIIIGHDHRFGKGRDGDEQKLKEIGQKYNFTVTSVEAVNAEGKVVSSSGVRAALSAGDIRLANLYLDRLYSLRGKVIVGEKRGRTLGFPTANIGHIGQYKLVPANGVYAVKIKLPGGIYDGVINIGKRPTFKDDELVIPEVNIFNFNSNIYGSDIEVRFVERLRGEVKFSSKEELIAQINKDKEESLKILSVIN